MIATRFAPSPTGLLHIGNLCTALVSYLHSRSNGGKFVLRIDNTDRERSEEVFTKCIKEDLEWLGLKWDLSFCQSDRSSSYVSSKKQLINCRRLYPCYENEEELNIKKQKLLQKGLPPIYDRSSLMLSENEKMKLEKSGVKPYWRFLMKNELITWKDGVRGNVMFDSKKLSDPILVRNNGTVTYNLASVVDDVDYHITDIVRGEDHISNSAVHLQLFQALGARIPNFSHVSLVKTKDLKLSKRSPNGSIKDLREKGILPESILNYLYKKILSHPFDVLDTKEVLIKKFSLYKLSTSPIVYQEQELYKLNEKAFRIATFSTIKSILDSYIKNDITEDFWLCMRDNLKEIKEVFLWWEICKKRVKTRIIDCELIKIALATVPVEALGVSSWSQWMRDIKRQTPCRGRKLFVPLRIAITGKEHGPELTQILQHIPRALLLERLSQ